MTEDSRQADAEVEITSRIVHDGAKELFLLSLRDHNPEVIVSYVY